MRIARLGLVAVLVITAWLAPAAHPDPAAADGGWLDGDVAQWSTPGAPVPAAPTDTGAPPDPRCQQQARPAETAADRQVQAAGWTLFGSYLGGWGIVSVKGLSGYDGMCRPMGYQEFVFVDGVFAGTISPDVMSSRFDGAGRVTGLFGPDQLIAEFARYKPSDPLCCPSSSTSMTY